MTSAARRASRESSMVQQPRAPVRKDCGFAESARCTPVTSWPGLGGPGGGDGGVHAARHGGEHAEGALGSLRSHSSTRVRGRWEPKARAYALGIAWGANRSAAASRARGGASAGGPC